MLSLVGSTFGASSSEEAEDDATGDECSAEDEAGADCSAEDCSIEDWATELSATLEDAFVPPQETRANKDKDR
ncbi:MAG: hypothetical protein K6F32_04655, partial [Bacilli bacterium]|nr:hypothetical protein [Bacilli bacterium]